MYRLWYSASSFYQISYSPSKSQGCETGWVNTNIKFYQVYGLLRPVIFRIFRYLNVSVAVLENILPFNYLIYNCFCSRSGKRSAISLI